MYQPEEMTTLSQVLNSLNRKGVDNEVKMNEERKMVSEKFNKEYYPEDLLILKNFRFEGDSNPSDNAVLYIVKDRQGNIGYILDSYGAYSNHEGSEFEDFIKKIPTNERDEEVLF